MEETEKDAAKTGQEKEVTLMKKPSELSRRRFGTKMENGQAKLISREGQIIKVLLNYKGFKLDEKGDVVPLGPGEKDPEKFLGGIEIFSLDPLNYVEIFPWEWDTVDSEGNKKHHKERPVDYIYLIPDVYYSELVARRETNENAAVTKDGATILRVKIGYTMRAKNPVKSRYNITNWTYTAVNDLNNQVRDLIGQYTLNELNSGMGDLGRIFFERIITDKVFRARINGKKIKEDRRFVKEKLDSYGVELSGIQILSIELPEEIKKSLSDPYTAEQTKKKTVTISEGERDANINKAEGERRAAFLLAEGNAAGTMGLFMNMVAKACGKTPEALQKEIVGNKELMGKVMEMAGDMTVRQMALNKNAYLDLRINGAEGAEKAILGALGAFKMLDLKSPAGAVQKSKEEDAPEKKREEGIRDEKPKEERKEVKQNADAGVREKKPAGSSSGASVGAELDKILTDFDKKRYGG
ncbi:MAG: SPFH domain-containing protein [Candidatus Paceibacterota bacterium]|jgi:regulator of protease activity HflC (stomatin/prohibitin superfamily)